MKHPMIRSRRMRYGSMTVYLTVALIAALVLFNAIFSALARYYTWYIDMTPDQLYSITDACRDQLQDAIDKAEEETGAPVKATIYFCEDYSKYEKGSVGYYIYNTAAQLKELYPDNVEVDWFDCWVEKKRAEELGVRASTNVVLVIEGGGKRVFNQKEFFVFEGSNTTAPVGYDGERVFATTLASLIGKDRPLAMFTTNHEELFFDDTLMLALRDAGYDINWIDLYYADIPEECELLITYNPNNDFIVSDGISETDEINKLNDFMARGGNMMVFMSASSPELPSFEKFLGEWGVSIGRTYDKETGHPFNAMVKDTSVSLTADGFTIYGDYVKTGKGAEITKDLQSSSYVPHVVFSDATVLLAPESFAKQDEATYKNGSRTRSDIFVGSSKAEPWACGAKLEGYSDLPLMTITQDSSTGGQVLVCSSIQFAGEKYLQSAVFGNFDALLSISREMGLEQVIYGLRYKPFASNKISSITTSQMLNWTLWLSITPAVVIAAAATFVLVRRKHS